MRKKNTYSCQAHNLYLSLLTVVVSYHLRERQGGFYWAFCDLIVCLFRIRTIPFTFFAAIISYLFPHQSNHFRQDTGYSTESSESRRSRQRATVRAFHLLSLQLNNWIFKVLDIGHRNLLPHNELKKTHIWSRIHFCLEPSLTAAAQPQEVR